MDSIAVEPAGRYARDEAVPDEARARRQVDALFCAAGIIEQTELNAFGAPGVEGEVNAAVLNGGAERKRGTRAHASRIRHAAIVFGGAPPCKSGKLRVPGTGAGAGQVKAGDVSRRLQLKTSRRG